MKQETIDILRRDLYKDKKKYESVERLKNRTYEIEMLPVLVERVDGKVTEITNYSINLLFSVEND